MTRIVFDARSQDAAPSGAKTRLLRLVPELAAREHDVTVLVSERFDAASAGALRGARVARARGSPGALSRAAMPARHARPLIELRPDVVVSETWPLPRVDLPVIAVVHDLRHVRAGGWRRFVAARWLADAGRRARRIHAVSESVRDELALLLPKAASRIDVVPNAVVVPEAAPPPTPLPEGVREPFAVAIGHAERRKDWGLVAAVAEALAAHGVQVVRAGRGVERHPGVVDLGVVSDAVRDALFRRAAGVLAPALLEGFGLVPLEALAAGAWVVASAIPAHREVLGDAADAFPPGDAGAAAALLLAATRATPAGRAARAARARARAGTFSPRRAADAFESSLRAAGY